MTDCLVCGDPATNGLNLDAKCLDDLAGDVAACAADRKAVSWAENRPRSDEHAAPLAGDHPDRRSRQEAT